MSNAVLLMHWGYRSKGKRDESMTGSSKEDSKFEQVVHKIDPLSKLRRTALVCDDASFPRTLGSATCAEICKLVQMGDASVPTPHNPSPPLRVRSRFPGDVIPYLPLQGKSPGLLFLKCT